MKRLFDATLNLIVKTNYLELISFDYEADFLVDIEFDCKNKIFRTYLL